MDFFRRASVSLPARLGVLPGTFNPPTIAHLALADAALATVDEVVFVLPRTFPHKPYEGAAFQDRLRMLEAATAGEDRFSIAATATGLFIDIARECRSVYGTADLYMLSGRDAAERIFTWDYGTPGAIAEHLSEYRLLVARRGESFKVPPGMRDIVFPLEISPACDHISATEVRARAMAGEPWEHMVPANVVPLAKRIYRWR